MAVGHLALFVAAQDLHFDPAGILHHVRVGDDVAAGVDDDSGPGRLLFRNETGTGHLAFVERGHTLHEDLNNGRAGGLRKVFEARTELGEKA